MEETILVPLRAHYRRDTPDRDTCYSVSIIDTFPVARQSTLRIRRGTLCGFMDLPTTGLGPNYVHVHDFCASRATGVRSYILFLPWGQNMKNFFFLAAGTSARTLCALLPSLVRGEIKGPKLGLHFPGKRFRPDRRSLNRSNRVNPFLSRKQTCLSSSFFTAY